MSHAVQVLSGAAHGQPILQRRHIARFQRAVAPPSVDTFQHTDYEDTPQDYHTSLDNSDFCGQPGYEDASCTKAEVVSIAGFILLILVVTAVTCMCCCLARSACCSSSRAPHNPQHRRALPHDPLIHLAASRPTQPLPRSTKVKV